MMPGEGNVTSQKGILEQLLTRTIFQTALGFVFVRYC
jgi:hypothetical protein